MEFIDAHTHLTEVTWQNMEDMYLAGIRTVVSPVNFASIGPVDASTIRDVWDQQIKVQLARAGNCLIKAYAMIGISMVSIPKQPQDLIKILPDYLKLPEVAALGEIGFEPGSTSCNDPQVQEDVVKAQIEIAGTAGVPIVFHLPPTPEMKKEYTQKLLAMCKAAGFPLAKVIIDHTSDANIAMVLEAGAFAAVTVQPWRKLTPEMAAQLVMSYGPERIIINSDCSGRASDPLAVAKTAYTLKKKGAPDETIAKVCYSNCKNVYAI